jgi:hypothetical protein
MHETIWRGFLLFVWALFAGSAVAATTPPADTLKVDYFSNANTSGAPDASVRLTNPGTAAGNICGSMFVFDENQELTECCSCLLTPDGLRTFSVNVDLTSHPLTGVILATGILKIVSTVPIGGNCPMPSSFSPEPALRAWATHRRNWRAFR